ncbi:MAG: PqqD family protein [Clostridia bacterium]|nr:PqqD family protein [Clostridia bacterium]
MKLSKDFISHDTGCESLLVPIGAANFSGLVKGNTTFGAIVELLGQEQTEESLVKAMCDRFDGPEDRIRADVRSALRQLREIGAIVE